MVDAYHMPDVQAVRKTIKQLRDVPANTTGAGQDVLLLISDYLVELGPKDGPVHWFCPKATQLTIDCATFLLRLHAYESNSIQTWRNLLTRCLRGCCDCVRGLAEAKVTSRHTYVGVRSESIQGLTSTQIFRRIPRGYFGQLLGRFRKLGEDYNTRLYEGQATSVYIQILFYS